MHKPKRHNDKQRTPNDRRPGPRKPGAKPGGPKQGGPKQAGLRQAGPRQSGPKPPRQREPEPRPSGPRQSGLWLYGLHAVRAALANPGRRVQRAVLTERAAEEIGSALLAGVRQEIANMDQVSKLLAAGSVHQGVALQV